MTETQYQQLLLATEWLDTLSHALWESRTDRDRHYRETLGQVLISLHSLIAEAGHEFADH